MRYQGFQDTPPTKPKGNVIRSISQERHIQNLEEEIGLLNKRIAIAEAEASSIRNFFLLRIVQAILVILIGIGLAFWNYGVMAAELPPELQAKPARPGWSQVSAPPVVQAGSESAQERGSAGQDLPPGRARNEYIRYLRQVDRANCEVAKKNEFHSGMFYGVFGTLLVLILGAMILAHVGDKPKNDDRFIGA